MVERGDGRSAASGVGGSMGLGGERSGLSARERSGGDGGVEDELARGTASGRGGRAWGAVGGLGWGWSSPGWRKVKRAASNGYTIKISLGNEA